MYSEILRVIFVSDTEVFIRIVSLKNLNARKMNNSFMRKPKFS